MKLKLKLKLKPKTGDDQSCMVTWFSPCNHQEINTAAELFLLLRKFHLIFLKRDNFIERLLHSILQRLRCQAFTYPLFCFINLIIILLFYYFYSYALNEYIETSIPNYKKKLVKKIMILAVRRSSQLLFTEFLLKNVYCNFTKNLLVTKS